VNARHQPQLYIGLMSGTSVDGIDAALIRIHDNKIELIAHAETSYSSQLRQQVLDLCQTGSEEIERMGSLDHRLGRQFALCVNELLTQNGINPSEISAIGSHGQTIRHRPPSSSNTPFTLQIGDPNIIAQHTGITTVADFRRRDIAAGGEGAPLAPAFHDNVFRANSSRRGIINIGGIGNITVLGNDQPCFGYDTGPGNGLMDYWINKHQKKRFDRSGHWAQSGLVNTKLLHTLLSHDYFHRSPPKSTGRELFNGAWLEGILKQGFNNLLPQDVQATLLELTVTSITQELTRHHCTEAYICGGGAFNQSLMKRLDELFEGSVQSTAVLGIAPQWVEACAFGWLAHQTMQRLPGNCRTVTGAKEAVILGGIYTA